MTEEQIDIRETISSVAGVCYRRRRWIIITACIVPVCTSAVLNLVPNKYRSEATLLVVQQQVPERYVVPTTSSGLTDALQAMQQEVLSRTRLLGIIEQFHLYTAERARSAPEHVIDLMRRNIDIQPLNTNPERRDFNAFRISFTAENPHVAQQVTSKLTALFIEENLRTREDQARNTTSFLSDQLGETEKRLNQKEEQLRDYKMRHLGVLPEQQPGNLAILAGFQNQLQATEASLNRAEQQRVYLESLLTGYRNLSAKGVSVAGAPSANATNNPIQAAQAELAHLQGERNELLAKYTGQHPDVVQLEETIARQSKILDNLRRSRSASEEVQKRAAAPPEEASDDPSVTQVKSQIEANRMDIASLLKEQSQLKSDISEYQNRLNATPVTEQQLAAVSRDYELLKKEYADLLNKQQQSQLATSLEKQQEGQQFRLVDTPNLPTAPSSPKRRQIRAGGVLGGLLLGLALAFLVEFKQACFYTEREVSKYIKASFVLGVPLLMTPAERRRSAWARRFEFAAGFALVILAAAGEFLVSRPRI